MTFVSLYICVSNLFVLCKMFFFVVCNRCFDEIRAGCPAKAATDPFLAMKKVSNRLILKLAQLEIHETYLDVYQDSLYLYLYLYLTKFAERCVAD